ncbi:hypothetical protein KBY93_05675 [Synechococcus sp. J7-Johnson]|uniref:hypothetical protein n=1 Tax=Synechococcus sp. J7-Johnson TaxID=2823737 RepID=UPI0020CBDD99|nr:hypothetical protein [Synechococcus sp. J7-Johnson]MCP9840125.1 hypothetical protein [Synechococcus sp. J7-Johnson]
MEPNELEAMEGPEPAQLRVLAASVASWQELGGRYGERVKAITAASGGSSPAQRAEAIDLLLSLGDLAGARDAVVSWKLAWFRDMPRRGAAEQLVLPDLLRCLADLVERCSDQRLLRVFWQDMERFAPPLPTEGVLPVLNRADLLEALLATIDVPVETLAIVDNCSGRSDADAQQLRQRLALLEREGYPGIGQVRVAWAFGNGVVAAAWNQILLSFPEAAVALIVNNDVASAPGILAAALGRIDPEKDQFMPLLPAPASFSAFLITALAWDRVRLFDEGFHPAYCEDLDYQDRLQACPGLESIVAKGIQQAMAPLNPDQSATIASDPTLADANRRSFQLNRLWYLYRRRKQQQCTNQSISPPLVESVVLRL